MRDEFSLQGMNLAYFLAIFAGVMKLNKNSFRLALVNSGVTALLGIAVLAMIRQNINGLTPAIILGNGLLGFLLMIPAYYISFNRHWNEGPVFSIRRLYTPLLICLFLLVPSMIYASVAFGYDWKEYYVTDGTLNIERISTHFLAVFVPVFLLHIIQMLAISNERDVIINASMLNIPKIPDGESDEAEPDSQKGSATKEENGILSLRGNTKSDTNLQLNIGQLFYVESDANYLKVAVFENNQLQIKRIRLTIKQFEEATRDFPQLMRCHRAFMVNMDHVTYYQGSVSKGELHFDVIKDVIPVSKTYTTAISDCLCQH